ncbi:hypothetical protein DICPUDRAFT_146999 [Dictyostelium purpureum]|uniref:Uncharacterized protein n=1 Tax=Dictyostelium purpureum TaxID=5786 RepID=F0Z7E4_DICPU|nr:uncharacterized protein DICPUDRAFT_146999 [Dictyostelium purpureum]EGC40126.1 hypothetical protein DICPUDRAFT_146999 [Dictyostelium purpureum]|eukprot:XP_003283316.1 hypothetical protein DICPUDRAFT_146999 [Dictyostelium purpureum]
MDEETAYEGEVSVSWGELLKSMIRDPETRDSLLENLKNISLFVASSMIVAKYAEQISEPKLLMKLFFSE